MTVPYLNRLSRTMPSTLCGTVRGQGGGRSRRRHPSPNKTKINANTKSPPPAMASAQKTSIETSESPPHGRYRSSHARTDRRTDESPGVGVYVTVCHVRAPACDGVRSESGDADVTWRHVVRVDV